MQVRSAAGGGDILTDTWRWTERKLDADFKAWRRSSYLTGHWRILRVTEQLSVTKFLNVKSSENYGIIAITLNKAIVYGGLMLFSVLLKGYL